MKERKIYIPTPASLPLFDPFIQVVNLDVVRDAITQLEAATTITREFLEVIPVSVEVVQ